MNSADRKQLIPWLLVALLAFALALSLLWILLHDCEDASGVQGSDPAPPAPAGEPGPGHSGGRVASEDFTIVGDLGRPIRPGVSAPLDLRLTNTGDAEILVSTLDVKVSGVSAPNADAHHPCTLADFSVDQAAEELDLSLAAGETGSLSTLQLPAASWPRVHMLDRPVNQDGCKDATLHLEYAGDARRAE